MDRAPRTARRALSLVAASLLLAAPAVAHPSFDGEAPVDSLATLTLDMAHGCGSESAGGAATTEAALEVPDWLRIVEAPEPEGWEVELEGDERTTTVTWRALDGGEPAPRFELETVVSGEPGEVRRLGVFQFCGQDSVRWVGTAEEPADDPAVRLTLTGPDPDRPPPPEEGSSQVDEPSGAPEGGDAPDEGAGEPQPDVPEDDEPTPDASDGGDGEEGEAADAATAAAADEGGRSAWWYVGLAAIVVVGLAVGRALQRRRTP